MILWLSNRRTIWLKLEYEIYKFVSYEIYIFVLDAMKLNACTGWHTVGNEKSRVTAIKEYTVMKVMKVNGGFAEHYERQYQNRS